MLTAPIIVVASFAYVGLLFAIAYYGDKRADEGRSIIANPYIYVLSLAVYCTSWTFYGSVGRAATSGIGFLPIYLGPTLMAALWWYVMLKIIRISKQNRITSIADFIASRYGKSQTLGGLVTIIAVVGIIPYIALQLKAISNTFSIVLRYPEVVMPDQQSAPLFLGDNTFYIAMLLAAFTILFGTRHLDATERHEGLVAAIAFESVVKLLAFIAVGLFVTFAMYDGFDDIFSRAGQVAEMSALLTVGGDSGNYTAWASLTFLSMAAIMFLPRQFQVAVVENVDERHLNKALWLFPLYLLAINIFVLPIAFGGLLHFASGTVDADTFVLTLPIAEQRPWLALFAFIGGLSAATGMVIVETIALSTMVCNDLVMPLLLRMKALRLTERRDLSGLLLGIRRGAIVLILVLGYLYFYLGGGPVRARHHRRHLLEGRHAQRRGLRPGSGFPDMDLHAAIALLCQVRLAADHVSLPRPVRHRVAQAAATLRARRPGRHHALSVLEHAGQYRLLYRRLADQAPKRRRARPGHRVRGCPQAPCGGARIPLLARQRFRE